MTYNILELKSNIYNEFENDLKNQNVLCCGLDTETTGLHIIKDKPFLFIFGWLNKDKTIKTYVSDTTKGFNDTRLLDLSKKYHKRLFAHNTKFDMHMLKNKGVDVLHYDWADSMAVARLTTDADDISKLALKSLAVKYVSNESNEFEKEVKKSLMNLNKQSNKQLDALLKGYGMSAKEALDMYDKGEILDDNVIEIITHFERPNYSHVPKELMLKYAANDVVIMLQYLDLAMPYVFKRNQEDIMFEEFELIKPLWKQERVGLKIDTKYLLESKDRVYQYLISVRNKFESLAGISCKSGQHELIKKVFKGWGYDLPSVNKDVLPSLIDNVFKGDAKTFAETLLKLRTIEKWYSTYIMRFINSEYNGRIYTSFNQFGAVSGRLSSDFQQFPKAALKDDEGNELFHPRKLIVPSGDGYNKMFMLDFSQMELRCQAHYTIITSGGDHNLCNAYMPFEVDPEGWEPTDLHTATAKNAFGDDCVNRSDFKQLRNASKTTNFAVIYGASTEKLCKIPALRNFSYQEVDNMRNAFYRTFPKITIYRNVVQKILRTCGYVKNAYGRRYYSSNPGYAHKICNYLIQGSCADMVKNAMINVDNYLQEHNLKTRVVLSVHDELFYEVYDGEEWCVPELQKIQQKAPWCKIPMVSEIMYTDTNWAEKKDWMVNE